MLFVKFFERVYNSGFSEEFRRIVKRHQRDKVGIWRLATKREDLLFEQTNVDLALRGGGKTVLLYTTLD